MEISLNFLHFIATVIVLLFLIIQSFMRYEKKKNKYDEAFSKSWGLIGYVNKEGRYISRVPSQTEEDSGKHNRKCK